MAFLVHVLIYVARAWRFQALIPPAARPGFLTMLSVSSAHNMAVYILPAKSGEATLPLYLKSSAGVPLSSGLASLLLSRVLDFATLSGALAAATLSLGATGRWQGGPLLLWAIALCFAALAICCFLVSTRGELILAPLPALLRITRTASTRAGERVLAAGRNLGEALRMSTGGRAPWGALLASLAIWGGIFLFYALLARGFGLDGRVGFLDTVLGSSLAVLTNLLPINAFAGFGTQEVGWMLGFGLVGVERDLAFTTGVGVHCVQLVNTLLLGVAGHVAMGLAPRTGGAAGR